KAKDTFENHHSIELIKKTINNSADMLAALDDTIKSFDNQMHPPTCTWLAESQHKVKDELKDPTKLEDTKNEVRNMDTADSNLIAALSQQIKEEQERIAVAQAEAQASQEAGDDGVPSGAIYHSSWSNYAPHFGLSQFDKTNQEIMKSYREYNRQGMQNERILQGKINQGKVAGQAYSQKGDGKDYYPQKLDWFQVFLIQEMQNMPKRSQPQSGPKSSPPPSVSKSSPQPSVPKSSPPPPAPKSSPKPSVPKSSPPPSAPKGKK
ncbi:MAG: hypothetical protein NTX50_15765, partial [Candidatus Sumerlaeota bacterium]|nr:hypothetical protein [Candidatus Sumerlaeota bacterium]